MAAGGVFTPGVSMERPGVYTNIRSAKKYNSSDNAQSGIAVIPFFNHSYGMNKKMIEVTKDTVNTIVPLLGYDITDSNENITMIREALKGCTTVKVYIAHADGKKAEGTGGGFKCTAKYVGSRGNDIKYAVVANTDGTFTVNVYLDATLKCAYEGIKTIADVCAIDCDYVDFAVVDGEASSSNAPTAIAGVTLDGGIDGKTTNGDVSKFLDSLDYTAFDTVLLPLDASNEDADETVIKVFDSKIKYLRNNIGKTIQGVVIRYAGDFEGLINVTNAPIVDDKTSIIAAAAFVAGISAGAGYTKTNTNREYEGATGFDEDNFLAHEDVIAALKKGEFVFTLSDDGTVVVESDINSLVTFNGDKDKSYRKNRVIRTLNELSSRLKTAFAPGNYDCTEDDFDRADGVCGSILNALQDDGAIKNVEDGDLIVDRGVSNGDEIYVTGSVQPVDSAEKIYITIVTS